MISKQILFVDNLNPTDLGRFDYPDDGIQNQPYLIFNSNKERKN